MKQPYFHIHIGEPIIDTPVARSPTPNRVYSSLRVITNSTLNRFKMS